MGVWLAYGRKSKNHLRVGEASIMRGYRDEFARTKVIKTNLAQFDVVENAFSHRRRSD